MKFFYILTNPPNLLTKPYTIKLLLFFYIYILKLFVIIGEYGRIHKKTSHLFSLISKNFTLYDVGVSHGALVRISKIKITFLDFIYHHVSAGFLKKRQHNFLGF